jgi:hypothetical protein
MSALDDAAVIAGRAVASRWKAEGLHSDSDAEVDAYVALDAALASGLCVLVDDLGLAAWDVVTAGWPASCVLVREGTFMAFKSRTPLYRLPVLIAEEEKP